MEWNNLALLLHPEQRLDFYIPSIAEGRPKVAVREYSWGFKHTIMFDIMKKIQVHTFHHRRHPHRKLYHSWHRVKKNLRQ